MMNSWITDVLEHHVSENQDTRPADYVFDLRRDAVVPTLRADDLTRSSSRSSSSKFTRQTQGYKETVLGGDF